MDKSQFIFDFIKSGKGDYNESLKAWDEYKASKDGRIREEAAFIKREMESGSDYREAHAAWVEYKRAQQ